MTPANSRSRPCSACSLLSSPHGAPCATRGEGSSVAHPLPIRSTTPPSGQGGRDQADNMALKDIVGIDHAVVLVRDLDQGAATWRRVGFTVSPRGTHSPQMGSGNYTIMLGPDYIELLGIIAETPHNAPSRAFLSRRGEGIERIAFTTTDAAGGAAEVRRRGYEPIGPVDFGRPVQLPGGGEAEARFSVFHWPVDEAPGGLRIFACQHKTREAVWIPELQKHANGARRLK